MAVVDIVSKVHVYNNTGMTGVAGSSGFAAADFVTDIYVWVAVMDDGTTYLAPAGGQVYRRNGDLSYAVPDWDLSLYGCDKSFTATGDESSVWFSRGNVKRFYFGENIIRLSGGQGSANANGTIATMAQAQVGSDSVPSGYTQVAPISEWEVNTSGDVLYYYIIGWVDTNYRGGTQQQVSMSSAQLRITAADNPELFEYFPWQRHVSGEWWSLNRQGPASTSAGLWRRVSGSYKRCLNRQGSASDKDCGFTYHGGWRKSPKSGKGA